jgi:hypothetical protein
MRAHLPLLSLVLALMFSSAASAYTEIKDVKAWSDTAATLYLQSDSKKLREHINEHVPSDQAKQIEQTVEAVMALRPQMGKGEYFDLLTEKTLGSSAKVLLYVLRFDKGEIYIGLRFVRVNTGWQLRNLQLNSDIEKVLQVMPSLI